MSKHEEVRSNRERFTDRIKSKYPDKDFSDDEVLFGQGMEDYERYDEELSGYQEREQALSNLFTNDPRSAAFLTSWRKGGNPVVELVRMFGEDFMEEMQDPENQEALAKASQEFAERVSREKDFEEQYQKNIEETLSMLRVLQEEEGMTDDDIDAAMEFLVGIMQDGILGKFSRESVHMALKALNHDSNVEEAAHEGEVRGRNAKIEEKLRTRSRTDGTASLNGKNSGASGLRSVPDLGPLNKYNGGKDIWERGGEKRKPAR